MVEGVSDTESDYNDVEVLDRSSGTLTGVSSTSDRAMNSSAAINDNLLNARRQLHWSVCVSVCVCLLYVFRYIIYTRYTHV